MCSNILSKLYVIYYHLPKVRVNTSLKVTLNLEVVTRRCSLKKLFLKLLQKLKESTCTGVFSYQNRRLEACNIIKTLFFPVLYETPLRISFLQNISRRQLLYVIYFTSHIAPHKCPKFVNF